jgi:hypothetical protein
MPYVSFRELAGESGQVSGSFQRSYTKTFLIQVDAVTDSVWYVGSHPQLPKLFDVHPADARAFCTSIAPAQDSSNPLIWRVTCSYAYTLDAAGGAGGIPATGNPAIDFQMQGKPPAERATAAAANDPLARPNDYSYGTYTWRKRAVRYDTVKKDGTGPTAPPLLMVNHPILRDWLARYPEVDDYCLSIRVGRNLPGAPNLDWLKLNGKLNANKCTIGTHVCEIGTARLMSTSAELVYEEGVSYWRWTHEILLMDDAKNWMFKFPSEGVNAMINIPDKSNNPGALTRTRIVDKYSDCSGMQPLTQSGEVWAKNQSQEVLLMEYNYIEFGTFPTVL